MGEKRSVFPPHSIEAPPTPCMPTRAMTILPSLFQQFTKTFRYPRAFQLGNAAAGPIWQCRR
eukprot:365535-Chlamydomonas_euryale.AAC.85